MSEALEDTTAILGMRRHDEKKRLTVAAFIIRLAQTDGNLDAAALRNRAVAALGGVAYSAALASSSTSRRKRSTRSRCANSSSTEKRAATSASNGN